MLSSSTKAADQELFVALSNATQRYEISSSHYGHATRWSVANTEKINDWGGGGVWCQDDSY